MENEVCEKLPSPLTAMSKQCGKYHADGEKLKNKLNFTNVRNVISVVPNLTFQNMRKLVCFEFLIIR